eukprot:TRINITY_DN221_c4_g1_i1.p1 TRINITY_DN221_c4_g1~~TRINITY_DN221_c4_g1_i1.p1  ORF type:complete len:463 (+),score=140.23 TRINITY_DN221_c4_g1_i1:209-1597(+)
MSRKKVKPLIIDEDEYEERLQAIIQRNFCPELPKLRDQLAWLEALETRDPSTIAKIKKKIDDEQYEASKGIIESEDPFPEDRNLSLDQFQSKYQTDDEEYFNKLMDDGYRKHRERYWWIYNNDRIQDLCREQGLIMDDGSDSAKKLLLENDKYKRIAYKSRNALMFEPDAIGRKELNEAPPVRLIKDQEGFTTSSSINPKAARFTSYDLRLMREASDRAAGVPVTETQEDEKRGHEFVTPISVPNPDSVTPVMTWGSVDKTPMILGPRVGPAKRGPDFVMSGETEEEKITRKLYKKRLQERKFGITPLATKKFAPKGSSTPHFMASTKVSKMTPAAQRLAASMLRKSGNVSAQPIRRHSQLRQHRRSNSILPTPSIITPSITPSHRHNSRRSSSSTSSSSAAALLASGLASSRSSRLHQHRIGRTRPTTSSRNPSAANNPPPSTTSGNPPSNEDLTAGLLRI